MDGADAGLGGAPPTETGPKGLRSRDVFLRDRSGHPGAHLAVEWRTSSSASPHLLPCRSIVFSIPLARKRVIGVSYSRDFATKLSKRRTPGIDPMIPRHAKLDQGEAFPQQIRFIYRTYRFHRFAVSPSCQKCSKTPYESPSLNILDNSPVPANLKVVFRISESEH